MKNACRKRRGPLFEGKNTLYGEKSNTYKWGPFNNNKPVIAYKPRYLPLFQGSASVNPIQNTPKKPKERLFLKEGREKSRTKEMGACWMCCNLPLSYAKKGVFQYK